MYISLNFILLFFQLDVVEFSGILFCVILLLYITAYSIIFDDMILHCIAICFIKIVYCDKIYIYIAEIWSYN